MVDRDGRNMNSQAILRPGSQSALGGPKAHYQSTDGQASRASLGQQYQPGPGQYDYAVGFQNVQRQADQAKQLKQQGVEAVGIKVVKNTSNFVSKKGRFDDRDLRDKALMPGPGQYAQDVQPLKTDHKVAAYN